MAHKKYNAVIDLRVVYKNVSPHDSMPSHHSLPPRPTLGRQVERGAQVPLFDGTSSPRGCFCTSCNINFRFSEISGAARAVEVFFFRNVIPNNLCVF